MIIYITIVCCCLAIYLYFNVNRQKTKTSKFKEIPLEKGLPIIGVVNNIKEPLCNYLFKLSQKHGPIYQIRFGMRNIVVLNTFEYIKAALVDNGDAFSGRWKMEAYMYMADNAGLFFIHGDVWAEQRSFVIKVLRDCGFGKSISGEIIQDECGHLLDDLEKAKGQVCNSAGLLSLYSVNVITRFVMNRRFTCSDPEFHNLERFMASVVTQSDPFCTFLLVFPFIERHEWLMKFIMWVTSRKSLVKGFHSLIDKEVKKHMRSLDFNSEGDDLIDRFLIMKRQKIEKFGNVGTFTDWQLTRNIFELLMAGIDTTAISLSWSFLFMAMYPDIQNKVYKEIVDKIGNERMPTMSDKVSLVYTQAVMDEISRLSSIVPLSDRHTVLTDVDLKGYFIPADTIIIPNLFACHLDPNVWEKPFDFHPEHFLLTDSNGGTKYRPREELIPFSMGKRQCLGESLARMEYFIFLISIIQRFQVDMVNKESHFDVFSGNEGIIRKPEVEEFIFTARP